MLISKKDLLNETKISYGQLYRWKREGLIPEDWFIKQPSFTGQETFFPKAKILKRIKAIQELKDKYSLEELSKILSPEVSERNFTEQDLRIIQEIELSLIPCFIRCFEKNSFAYIELLVLITLSSFKKEHDLSIAEVEKLCKGIKNSLSTMKQTDYIALLLGNDDKYFIALYPENTQILIDERLVKLSEHRLSEISANIKLKYRKSFNFILEEEEEEESPFDIKDGKVVPT